jgi:hypothetical protein
MPTTAKMTEEQMVGLVRNALLVAGLEMGGPEGDHWPVIKDTIHNVMKDWEDLKTERNVHAEMRVHLYAQLEKMEAILTTCPDDVKADAAPKLKQLRELYDAHFTEIDKNDIYLSDEETPAHVKRAEAIIKTLEADDV